MGIKYHNSAFYTVVQSGRCPLGVAWPGCAKSASLIAFAKSTGRKLYILIGSIREPSDFGIPFLSASAVDRINAPAPPRDVGKKIKIAKAHNDKALHVQEMLLKTGDVVAAGEGMPASMSGEIPYFVLAAPKWAADTYNGDEWIVGLDELTCCPPAVQAGMLRFVAENWVGDLEMPRGLWKCALANPSDIATNGFDIEPAMANRMVHLRWEMDWESWKTGMQMGGHFPAPRFPIVPDNWRTNKAEVGTMFAAFQHHRPDAFRPDTDAAGAIKVERSKLSGAWPSPRSWDIAMDCRAAGLAAGVDKSVLLEMLEGCVGPVALEFDTWENSLDLPDPEECILHAMKAVEAGKPVPYKHPNRPDKVIAFLGSVAARIVGDRSDEARYNVKRWEAGMHIFTEASKHECDIAIACATQMLKSTDGASCYPLGASFPKEFRERCFPTVQATFLPSKGK